MGQMVSAATTQLGCCSLEAASDNTQTNEHGPAPIKLELKRTLKSGLHVSFMCHKILLCTLLLQPSKNVKSILSLLAAQKQVAGWIWPSGLHSMQTPALDYSLHCIQSDPFNHVVFPLKSSWMAPLLIQ